MTSRGWPAILIMVLAALAVGAGLVLTGGPGQARQERRDRQRDGDLANLSLLVRCLADLNGRHLPERLETTPDCDWQPRLNDPGTGKPYRYQVTGPNSYRLCADFELPDNSPPGPRSRDAEGCVSRDYLPGPRGTPGADAGILYRP